MALTTLDLSGTINVLEGCSKLTFCDTTGFKTTTCTCDQNDNGYGLTGGIDVDDVSEAILNVYFPNSTIPYKFTFQVDTSVITECILTDLNGNDIDITSFLESTAFPLKDFYVNFSDYTIIFPALTDGIVNWDYTISGVSGVESFVYTTSDGQLVDCKANCCIENKYLELDESCDCFSSKIDDIIKSEIFLNAARYAVSVGDETKSQKFLDKSFDICGSNCKNC